MAPDQNQCRLPTPPVALDDALPAPAARRLRPQRRRAAVNALGQSRLAAGDAGRVVHALVHVSPSLVVVLQGSTDDSSLPERWQGNGPNA